MSSKKSFLSHDTIKFLSYSFLHTENRAVHDKKGVGMGTLTNIELQYYFRYCYFQSFSETLQQLFSDRFRICFKHE